MHRARVSLVSFLLASLMVAATDPSLADAQPAAKPSGKAVSKTTVSVGGLRIVGTGFGDNGTEERPFNEGNGMTIVLVLKAPKGAGLVEIEDDDSTVEIARDDKGTDLRVDADFGSFPDITKDGSTGLIDLKLDARPAAGATSITVEGSVAVTSANGTRVQKATNVSLTKEKAFKLGTAAVTVGSVEPSEEGVSVTFNLPRSAMSTIKTLRFKDAKGAVLEAEPTGSGYFNDNGEMMFRIKTKAKAVNIEADVWQGLKNELVPFTITFGLGL